MEHPQRTSLHMQVLSNFCFSHFSEAKAIGINKSMVSEGSNFLSDRSTKSDFSSIEAVLGGLLDGGWYPERSSHVQKLEIFSPISSSLEKGERLKLELLIQLCQHDIASIKIPKLQGSKRFQVSEHIYNGRETHLNSMRTEAPVLGIFQTWPYVSFHLDVHLYLLLYPLLYNKLVHITRCFPKFCELFQQIN